MKKLATRVIDKAGLRRCVDALQTWINRRKHSLEVRESSRQMSLWREGLKKEGLDIHGSTEFTGRLPFDFLKIGHGTTLQRDISIWLAPDQAANPYLNIGEDSFVGRNTFLGVYEPITVGAHVQIAAYCYLVSQNHGYSRRDIPIKHQDFVGEPITIEDDVWLGTHVVVLPGVTIGKGAIVAAGSIVNKSIPPYEIWGGAPAKRIKNRPE